MRSGIGNASRRRPSLSPKQAVMDLSVVKIQPIERLAHLRVISACEDDSASDSRAMAELRRDCAFLVACSCLNMPPSWYAWCSKTRTRNTIARFKSLRAPSNHAVVSHASLWLSAAHEDGPSLRPTFTPLINPWPSYLCHFFHQDHRRNLLQSRKLCFRQVRSSSTSDTA